MAEDEGDRVSGIAAVASEAAATRAPAEANGDGGPRANGPAPEKEPTLKASPADLSPVRTTTETSSSAGAATERGASNDDLGAPSPSTRRSLAVWDYVCAELGLSVGAREDDPDMAVARERVFDIIWHIPLEFERLNFYGGMLCMDATLGVVTSLPVRVVCQTARLIMSPALGVVSAVGTLVSPSPSTKTKGGTKGSTIGSPGSRRRFNNPGDSTGGRTTSRKRRTWGFHPYAREHLSDSLWLFMLLAAFAAAKLVDVSVVYHYIRGQEVIKLYLACSVLECFDKLCCAFNCHVLDALQNSVYILVNTAQEDCSTAELINATFQLAFDAALTLAATCAHAICEKVVAPLKQENLKLRHKLAEAVSTITKTLEPEIQRLRAETLILLSSQTVIRSDAESIRVRVEALEEEPIPPPARTDPAIMSRIAALEGGRREERTPVEDEDDEECGHRHRRMRLWEPHY